MPRRLYPVEQRQTTDWEGHFIPKAMIDHLFPTCVVRVVIQDDETEAGEAIYFEITKIKDGTFWGTARDTYRCNTIGLQNSITLKEGDQFTWRREHINEIPLNTWHPWQPKRYIKLVRGLEGDIQDKGCMTGVRGT